MSANRHQTVTQTGSPKGTPRKLRAVNDLPVRRAGIEPATYSFSGIVRRARSWFSPLRIARNLVESLLGEPRKGKRNRNATVIRFSPQTSAELERAAREEIRQFAFRKGS